MSVVLWVLLFTKFYSQGNIFFVCYIVFFRIKILQSVFQMPKKFFLITQLFIINVTFKNIKFVIFWSVGQEYSLFMINGCIHCIQ